jgi:hypothetical protein
MVRESLIEAFEAYARRILFLVVTNLRAAPDTHHSKSFSRF